MHVLVVVDRYYPLGGGIQQYVRGLCRELRRRGNEITILTMTVDGTASTEDWEEGRVRRTAVLDGALTDPGAVARRWPELAEFVAEYAPDVVFANNHASVAAVLAARELGIPVVYYCHGWGLLCARRVRFLKPDQSLCFNDRSVGSCLACLRMARAPRVTGVRSLLGRMAWERTARREIAERVSTYDRFQAVLESADARIGNSELTARMFTPGETHAIHLGLCVETYRRAPGRSFAERYGIAGDYVVVTSRIHDTKGQDWAVRALAGMPPDLHLVLAGNSRLFAGPKHEDSPHVRRVSALVEELGLGDRVVLPGFLDTTELVEAYSGALATIVPSVWLEPFGYVTAEAMACECPVVVTENSGSAEIVRDGVDGFVIPRRSPEAIASAVAEIRLRREEMGKAARETVVNTLGWERIGAAVLDVLQGVIERRRLDSAGRQGG
jgi:glycosyltransferase involved in cell wall biosynthesis